LFGPERLLPPGVWRSALRFLPDSPPCPRFCHRGAGFRSVFTTQRSHVEWLGTEPGAFASMTFRVARRLSRSAIVTIREHDHETAQTRSPCAQSPACTALLDRDLSISFEPTVAAASFEARPAEVSPIRGWRRSSCQRLLPRSLVTRALPRPDPLEHLMSRDRCDPGLDTRVTGSSFKKKPLPALASETDLRLPRLEGRLSLLPAKGIAIRRTRGAFHRQSPSRRRLTLRLPPHQRRSRRICAFASLVIGPLGGVFRRRRLGRFGSRRPKA
jgi:hypothetical protein